WWSTTPRAKTSSTVGGDCFPLAGIHEPAQVPHVPRRDSDLETVLCGELGLCCEDHVTVERGIISSGIALVSSLRPQFRRSPPYNRCYWQIAGFPGEVVESVEASATSGAEQITTHLVVSSLGHRYADPGGNEPCQPRLASPRLVRTLGVGHERKRAGIQEYEP